MSQTRILISSLLVLMLLVGCGKRGPLYVPGQGHSQQTTSEQQEQTAPAEDTSAE